MAKGRKENVKMSLRYYSFVYDTKAVVFTLLNFLFALAFCIGFFYTLKDLPDIIPVHWSEQGGFDKFGEKSQLYPIGISAIAVAALAFPASMVCIKKSYNGFAYLFSGISMFLTCVMILVYCFMRSGITQ